MISKKLGWVPIRTLRLIHLSIGFLAESWHIESNGAFAATCIGSILLVMAMEALRRLGKEYDDWILRGFKIQAAAASTGSFPISSSSSSVAGRFLGAGKGLSSSTTTNVVVAGVGSNGNTRTVLFRASPLQQVIRSFIHAVVLGLAYIVMLLVMSFNGYVIICVIIGGGLGKFFCDWMVRPMIVSLDGSVDAEESTTGIEEPSICCN